VKLGGDPGVQPGGVSRTNRMLVEHAAGRVHVLGGRGGFLAHYFTEIPPNIPEMNRFCRKK